jgi:hypothetical protein
LASDLWEHVASPEAFFSNIEVTMKCFSTNVLMSIVVFGYLSFVWMFRLLPAAYYDTEGNETLFLCFK